MKYVNAINDVWALYLNARQQMRMRKGAEKAKRRPHTVDTVIACDLFVIHPSIFTIDKIFHSHGAHQTLS